MSVEDPGPIRDSDLRQDLRQRYASVAEAGIANRQKAILMDPDFDDAMAYTNLLIRERARLLDDPADDAREVAAANQWVQKALDAKSRKAQAGKVSELQLISGRPLLVPSAAEAAKQWVYQPTVADGLPVQVLTQIEVSFSIGNPGTAPGSSCRT